MKTSTCSVIIPVYNGEGTLVELIKRLGSILPGLFSQFEVVLINDDSPDQSWQVIQQLSGQYPWVRGINLMRNFGQHNALLCGIRAAQYATIVTMDDDLQHPPEEISRLIDKLAEGYQVVYGIPRKLPHAPWRNIFSRMIKSILAYVMGVPRLREIGAYRAFRTDLRSAFASYESPHVIIDVLLSWATTSFGSITVEEQPRLVGKSNYSFGKLVATALFILTAFSTAPLRFASIIGFIMVIFGFGAFMYVIVLYLIAGSIPGFPFLASIISLFSGTQLFALGIFGEYLARIFDRSMDRPQYFIKETVGNSHSEK